MHPEVSLVIACGSRQVFQMLADNGSMAELIKAGARILECACGPCIGMGQSPKSAGVSLRTINRNFKGRTGTKDAEAYLVSPETAAASAVAGVLTDPRSLGEPIEVEMPEKFAVDDSMFIFPEYGNKEVRRGPNIKALPLKGELEESLKGEILLKVGDNITTDHIMPAGAKILPLRSNIPAMAEHVFEPVDSEFPARAKEKGGGIVLGGDNYGQGSSREHAALAPMYLGVTAVIAKSMARIHGDNLVNFGIVPLILADPAVYEEISLGDQLEIKDLKAKITQGDEELTVQNLTTGQEFTVNLSLSDRQREVLSGGGTLNYMKKKNG